MYKPTFIPNPNRLQMNASHNAGLKRPVSLLFPEDDEDVVQVDDADDDEEEEGPQSLHAVARGQKCSASASTTGPLKTRTQPQQPQTHSNSIFSPRPHKRQRTLTRPLVFGVSAHPYPKTNNVEATSNPLSLPPLPPAHAHAHTPESTPQPQPQPQTPRKPPPSSSHPHPSPSSSNTYTYTPYPPLASDSPSNPLGPARVQSLRRTIPCATSLARHVVLRFQVVRVGSAGSGGGGGEREEDRREGEGETEREGEDQEEDEEHQEEHQEDEGEGKEDTPTRQGGVHRIVRVPMSYTFTHLKHLIAWLFDEDARCLSRARARAKGSLGRKRRDTWFDDEEEEDDDEDGDEDDDDEEDPEDPFSFPNSNSNPTSNLFSSAHTPAQTHTYPYLFEVQKKITTYSPLYKPGQIKTGTTFVKLSSVRDPARRWCLGLGLGLGLDRGSGGGAGDGEGDGEGEDELFWDEERRREGDDANEAEDTNGEETAEEEEEEWKWADEEEFTLGHVFPRGIDGEIGIVYRHSASIEIHMTVNKSPVAAQKGKANTPFVFSAQGHTTARMLSAGLVPIVRRHKDQDRQGQLEGRGHQTHTQKQTQTQRQRRRRRRRRPLPLPKPVISKTVEDILSSSPGHYSKAQVRSTMERERERGLGGGERGRKRRMDEEEEEEEEEVDDGEEEEEDVERAIWSPFVFKDGEERKAKRRRMEEQEEEGKEQDGDVEEMEEENEREAEEEEDIEVEEEEEMSDTDAEGDPDELHDLDEDHPFFLGEAEGSSPIKDEIILASDSEDSMYEDDEQEQEQEQEEEEMDEWNAPDAFLHFLQLSGFHHQRPEPEVESDDDELLNTRKRIVKRKSVEVDDDEDEVDDVIFQNPSSTPGLTTCASSSSSLPPSSPPPPPHHPIPHSTSAPTYTNFKNFSSASLPARFPDSLSSSFSSSFSSSSPASSHIVLHHHYPNKKYSFTPAPPRDPLCRLMLNRLEKRLRKMKSEGMLTAYDEPPDEAVTKGEPSTKPDADEEIDELADTDDKDKANKEKNGEIWDPFGDEVEL